MVWPFRKEKARIRASWLASNNISSSWDNSFNKSKKELRADIQQQTDELATLESRLKELEEAMNKGDLEMTMLKEASNDPDISEQVKRANLGKLKELEGFFTRDADNMLKAMQGIKVAINTRWLLENILNKHFTDQSAYRIHRSLRPYLGPRSLQSCQKLTILTKIISTKCTITTGSPTPRNQKMKPVMRPVTSTT